MEPKRNNLTVSTVIIFASAFSLAAYFMFAAVQGEYGLFRHIQIKAQERDLSRQLASLNAKLTIMQNKTRRMSDNFLDLDLLDEQARKVLGLVRGDEIVIR